MLAVMMLASIAAFGQTADASPDADGVYAAYNGVRPARLLQATAAVIPPGAGLATGKHITTLSMVIGVDGTASRIEVVSAQKSPLDDAAIAAVKQSQFEPGTLDGKPVPVHAFVWVPFLDAEHPAIPVAGPLRRLNDFTMPKPLKTVEAEFSDEARRKRISGSLLVSFVITEEGLPVKLQVLNPLGAGLDEEALKSVRQYRFAPATLEGIAVPVPLTVEISFHLGGRY